MSKSIKRPYVGVSGVTSPEVQEILEHSAAEIGLHTQRRLLALGVKAVHKTQFLDIENKYGKEWYPVGEQAFNSSLRHDNENHDTIAVAQAYFDLEYVDDKNYRNTFLDRIIHRGRPWLQAIQFDMLPWHANSEIPEFLETVKSHDIEVFLQAHKYAMDELGPQGVARRLGSCAHILDYVLFDASHGTGKRLDTVALQPFIEEAYSTFDSTQTGIAIAGGLNATNVRDDLPDLIARYPQLSWDAEGQLHPVNRDGKRPLDLMVAKDYLRASSEILNP